MSKVSIVVCLSALLLFGCVAKVSSDSPKPAPEHSSTPVNPSKSSDAASKKSAAGEMNDEMAGARTELANVKEELAGIAASGKKLDGAALDKILSRLEAAENRLNDVLARAEKLEREEASKKSHDDHDHDGHDHDGHDHDH